MMSMNKEKKIGSKADSRGRYEKGLGEGWFWRIKYKVINLILKPFI